jgi:hypothetical protein
LNHRANAHSVLVYGPRLLLAGGFFLYLGFHLASLSWFPFVHSDEAWLASLTRTILQSGSMSATEDFFRLTPRYPHAIKALFHLLQVPFVALSFSHLSVRVISLLGGFAALGCFYAALRKLDVPTVGALAATLLLGVDVQFFSGSHVARQEILLVAIMAAAFCVAFPLEGWRWKTPVLLGSILGAGIGFHPNAFIVTLPILALVPWVRASGRRKLAYFAIFVGTLALWAGLFVGWSYAMDPDFPSHYLAFGQSVGVADSPLLRLLRLRLFFVKLYNQIAGTYYLPPVRLQLLVFGGLLPLGALAGFVMRGSRGRHLGALVTAAASVVVGLYLVGKLAPPTALFLWLPCYFLGAALYHYLSPALGRWLPEKGSWIRAVPALLLAASLTTATAREALRFSEHRYGDYISRIRAAVPPDRPVLGNLNTAFAFDPGVLHTYRDLARLDGPIADYLETEDIRYVLLPAEMEVIHAERPQWNLLYGNIYPYFGDLLSILDSRGILIDTVEAPVYAMRIVPYMFTRNASLRIYRLADVPE